MTNKELKSILDDFEHMDHDWTSEFMIKYIKGEYIDPYDYFRVIHILKSERKSLLKSLTEKYLQEQKQK